MCATDHFLAEPNVWAGDASVIGKPSVKGEGCAKENTSSTLMPDQVSALSILFDKWIVETGKPTHLRRQTIWCTTTIPLHLEPALGTSGFSFAFRGAQAIPIGGRRSIVIYHQFLDSKGPIGGRRFSFEASGPVSGDIFLESRLDLPRIGNGNHSRSLLLITRVRVSVSSNKPREQTSVWIDSMEMSRITN